MKQPEENKQSITVILKDVANDTFLFHHDYPSSERPWQVANDAVHKFFDQHYQTFAAASPKDFIIYYKSSKLPPTFMTAKLIVEEFTIESSVMGYKGPPAEETFPYFLDTSVPADVDPPDEFPPEFLVVLGIRAPGMPRG